MYRITLKLYIDSTSRRTAVAAGSFDTLAEALAYVASEYPDGLETGEEVDITALRGKPVSPDFKAFNQAMEDSR